MNISEKLNHVRELLVSDESINANAVVVVEDDRDIIQKLTEVEAVRDRVLIYLRPDMGSNSIGKYQGEQYFTLNFCADVREIVVLNRERPDAMTAVQIAQVVMSIVGMQRNIGCVGFSCKTEAGEVKVTCNFKTEINI